MARLRSRLAVLAVAILTAIAVLAAPAHADNSNDPGKDNIAYAVNTKDGSSLFKLAFDIRAAADGIVDTTNAAVAYASCTACRTVAIAIQVVLVTAPASIQTPTNIAIAINEKCSSCETLATAYQFIVPTNGPVHFTRDGQRAIDAIQAQLRALANSTFSVFELQARVDALAKELQQILATQLVRGPPDGPDDQHSVFEQHIPYSPSTTSTTTTAATTASSSATTTTSTTSGPTSTVTTTSTP
jgi:putative peptide zinc metalloprotease protein